jgi:threonylcarbamoyladenosine tRNA methylthiotransferase MtaB
MRERLLAMGYREVPRGEGADTYLINTCTVTRRADSESLALIRRARRQNPSAKIIVTGCLTELDAEKIKETDRKSLILKNSEKEDVPLVSRLSGQRSFRRRKTTGKKDLCFTGVSYFSGRTRAFLKIQDGCDNFCSYCKVPLVRGRSRSRGLPEIVAEAHNLVKNGFKELVLTGICLGAYGKDLKPTIDLVDVIEALEKIDGLLSSIEAGDVSERLIHKISKAGKLSPHLHIPLQSGDDRILKMMNRGYTRDYYLGLIKRLKAKRPQIAITTDVLVGFPGEEEENFQNTVKLIKEITPLKVHIFPYSERKGTQAAKELGLLNEEPLIIKQRSAQLKKISDACSFLYQKRFIGKVMDVLIEDQLKGKPAFWEGHADNYMRVIVRSGKYLKNELISLKINKILKGYLLAIPQILRP